MSDREYGRLAAEAVMEGGREVANDAPMSGTTLRADDLDQVAAAGSNTVRMGQETN